MLKHSWAVFNSYLPIERKTKPFFSNSSEEFILVYFAYWGAKMEPIVGTARQPPHPQKKRRKK
jgi:hypothetical protein